MKSSVKKFYEKVASEKGGNYNPTSGRLTSMAAATQQQILRAMRSIILPLRFSLVLDVGSGTGRYAGLYRSHGAFHIYVDAIRQMLQLARERAKSAELFGSADFIVADVERLPIRNGSCDFVACLDVLHHLGTQEKRLALGEIGRVATPAGYVFIEIKNSMFPHYMMGISRRNPTGVSKPSNYFSIRTLFHSMGFHEVHSIGAMPWKLAPKMISPSILIGFRKSTDPVKNS